jgi:hypothetical protein
MSSTYKYALLISFGFVTIWDTITTVTGTMSIIGDGDAQLFIAVIFGVMISSFLVATIPLLENPSQHPIIYGAKFMWLLAVSYDLYTSFMGNLTFIVDGAQVGDIAQKVITIGITLFVSSSPIAISYLLNEV